MQDRIILGIIMGILCIIPISSFQQGPATVGMVETGLHISDELSQAGDEKGARYATEFAARHFASGVHDLREYDRELAEQAHILLLDAISDPSITGEAITLIDKFDIKTDPDQAILEWLTAADEEYAEYKNGQNEAAYHIAKELFAKSKNTFEDNAGTSLADTELQSFFDDIEDAVLEKESFIKVGNLVGAIQRDIIGTETVTLDQPRLYENIRDLYALVIQSTSTGDYDTAEEYAIEAYLENFEYLEPALEQADEDFMRKLETNMRENLIGMIRDKDDAGMIRSYITDTILPDLNKGETLVANINIQEAYVPTSNRERGDATSFEKSDVRYRIDIIRQNLHEMLAHYDTGDYQSAYASARTAYLDSYEYVEIPLRPIDPDFTLEVEYQFAELRNLIKQEASYDMVQNIAVQIRKNLDESERLVTGSGLIAPWIAFTASFAIIFREGLESVLILGAIVTYLEASRNSRFKPYIHYGVIAAIGATAVTWVIASYIIEISGANRELIEAIAALSATAVLFYVSFWILNKIEHKKWMEFVKAKVWQATTTGSVMVFVMLSFFTVYREGFETVLFYQAMFSFAKYMEAYVSAGFVVGIVSLLLIYYIMRRLGKRLPLRALFGLTMGIGAYLSIAFLGNAIREFQVLDYIPYTGLFGIIPRLDINLATMTGIYPTLETITGQFVLLSVYLIASAYILIIRPKRERKLAEMRKSRGTHETD